MRKHSVTIVSDDNDVRWAIIDEEFMIAEGDNSPGGGHNVENLSDAFYKLRRWGYAALDGKLTLVYYNQSWDVKDILDWVRGRSK